MRRVSPDGAVQHVINRGNRRATIFHQDRDYDGFLNLICDAMERVPMRILAVCLMPNHFHLVLWPLKGSDLPAYMQWLLSAHARQHHRRHETTGLGHVYQDRYRNFLVQSDAHLYNVLRYVEGNALRARLVTAAEHWRYSSLTRRFTPDGRTYLSEWPVPRPPNWSEFVNEQLPVEELRKLRSAVQRDAPYGGDQWVDDVVRAYGLESRITLPGEHRGPAGADAGRQAPS
jgi:putative transposase